MGLPSKIFVAGVAVTTPYISFGLLAGGVEPRSALAMGLIGGLAWPALSIMKVTTSLSRYQATVNTNQ